MCVVRFLLFLLARSDRGSEPNIVGGQAHV